MESLLLPPACELHANLAERDKWEDDHFRQSVNAVLRRYAKALCSLDADFDTSGEDVASLGMLMTFGKTRILDLGDLTWDKELELVCPVNRIGKVDVYFVPGHGNELSNIAPEAAFDPLVALLQNGSRKGGDADVIREVDSFPALKGFWRLHASNSYPDLDGDPAYISNVQDRPDADYPLDLKITKAGKITVTNPRNGFSKTYQARGAEPAG